MTTATDWDVRDRETNDRLTVTEVRARIDALDGAATEAPVQIEPWIPRDPHAAERCACGKYHQSALIAPASNVLYAEGSTVAAEMVRGIDRTPGWPTWLGDVHHADATWTQAVTDLRSWADTYTARPIERTVVQPVEVDTSWRESEAALYAEMVLAGRDHETGKVLAGPYSELAPDRIAGPPHRQDWTDHDRQDDQDGEQPPDRTGLDKLAKRVPTALTTGEQPAQAETETESERKPWWRSEWVAAAGIVVAWAAAMAALVVLA